MIWQGWLTILEIAQLGTRLLRTNETRVGQSKLTLSTNYSIRSRVMSGNYYVGRPVDHGLREATLVSTSFFFFNKKSAY